MPFTDGLAESMGASGVITLDAPETPEPTALGDTRSTQDTFWRMVRKYNAELCDIAGTNPTVQEAMKFVAHAVWVFCRQRGITDYTMVRMENPTLTRDGQFTFRLEEQRPTT
jgi:hypothetical protein